MDYIRCGGLNVAYEVAEVTRVVYFLIMILVPLVIMFFAIKDLVLILNNTDEESVKNEKLRFIKKTILAISIFSVLFIISMTVKALTINSENRSYIKCISCIINDESKCSDEYEIVE